jgi:hypothetical protein
MLIPHLHKALPVACYCTDTLSMTEKNQDYTERYKEWREISVTQLSATNNILLTISVGLLAFSFNKEEFNKIHFDTAQSICWTHFFYVASIISLALSMTFGIAVLFSRLYDFRISRHLALTRKRLYSKKQGLLPDDDLGEINMMDRLVGISKVLFIKLPFVTKTQIDNYQSGGQLTTDFNSLRRLANVLGAASWRWTKVQTLLFFLSVLFYILHLCN